MAITTYAELQAAAANWLVRGDLTARVAEFIDLAEARLNRVLRARLAETEVAMSATVGVRMIPLPAAFAEPLALWLVSGGERQPLRFAEPRLMAVSSTPGRPCAWGIDGGNLAFERPCDAAYGLVLRMLTKFSLSDTAPTNSLLTDHPDAYLFATLCEAAPFLRDADLAGAYEARLDRAIAEINAKDARARAPRTLVPDTPRRAAATFDITRGY
ncbi:hypothetical protein [Phenylobacterium sp.]|uniref:phage adaptor protein n=1 Tax=Phenylobacterium sp. TaxID=1871053 RepID=UPI00286B7912|nr:hypothetical protein [Phenylobacterium sp.]